MKIRQIIESRDLCAVCGQTPCNCTHVDKKIVEFVTPQAVAQDPGLEREKDVDVIFFGRPGQDYNAEDAWAALEEVLPAEYPQGSEKAQYKIAEVAKSGGAVVTTKPLSVAKKLVSTFNNYGIKSRINQGLNEFAAGAGGDSGDYLRALASAWYNGVFDTGSLPKGIKTQEDVERLLNRGIVCPDGKTRKLHIDYNSNFDGVEIYSDDYYEHGDESGELDSRTGQPFGPYDHMEFKDEELDEGVADGLNEFAPAGGGGNIPRGPKTPRRGPWDDSGEDPYQLRRYNRSADFFDQFDSGGVDKQKFDKATGEYEGYYFDRDAASGITQIAYFKFDDPTKIGDNDPGVGWYYEPVDEGVAEGSLNEFAPDSNDGGEEDILHKYARMWWAGDEATQMQIERALAKMGWEIGEDEGSYDNGGVFVVRAGDVNGNSYISWPAEELDEGMWDAIKKSFTPDPNWQQRAGQAAGHVAQGAVAAGAHGHPVGHAMADTGVHEGNKKPEPPEADYGADYQDMVKRVKQLAGLGPLKTVYDPKKRVYKNMPTAVQPRK